MKQRILKWLGIEEMLTLALALLRNEFKEQRDYDIAVRDRNLADEAGERHRVEFESLSRDKSQLDQIRLNHESILNSVKDIVESHVEEHLTKLQATGTRHIACPTCGKSYNLATLGIAYNTRSITLVCDNCKAQFDIRPSTFWNKIEVEKR